MTKDNRVALMWALVAVVVISFNVFNSEKESPIIIDRSTAIEEHWSEIMEYANGTETINACNEDSGRCYDVDADIYNGIVDEIFFSSGGHLQFGADIDERGDASDFDVEGHAWDFIVDMDSTTIDNAVTEWANSNGYTIE